MTDNIPFEVSVIMVRYRFSNSEEDLVQLAKALGRACRQAGLETDQASYIINLVYVQSGIWVLEQHFWDQFR